MSSSLNTERTPESQLASIQRWSIFASFMVTLPFMLAWWDGQASLLVLLGVFWFILTYEVGIHTLLTRLVRINSQLERGEAHLKDATAFIGAQDQTIRDLEERRFDLEERHNIHAKAFSVVWRELPEDLRERLGRNADIQAWQNSRQLAAWGIENVSGLDESQFDLAAHGPSPAPPIHAR